MDNQQIPQLGLNEALRRSTATTHNNASGRDRSRSTHREASNVLVPPEESDDSELRRERQFDAFLAQRQFSIFSRATRSQEETT